MTAPLVVNGGKAEYFELDIRKLKPNTQYVVKVRQDTQTHTHRRAYTEAGRHIDKRT